MTMLSGGCLCGAVSFQGDCDIKAMGNCHCTDCRTVTGAAYATLVIVPESDVKVTGELREYSHTSDAGSTMTKQFCGTCGSQMFSKNSSREGMIAIRAGAVDQKAVVQPAFNVYCSSAMPSTPMNPDIPAFQKMPE